MCAQWTNLGGGIFQFFEKSFEQKSNTNPPGGGGLEDKGQPSGAGVRRSSEKFGEVRRSSEKFGEVRGSSGKFGDIYPRLPPGDRWSKNAFPGEIYRGARYAHWIHLDAPNCRIVAKDVFLRQRVGILRKSCCNSTEILLGFYSDSTGFYWILLDSTGFYWILLDSTISQGFRGGGVQRTELLASADGAVDRRHFAGWGGAH